ncbi:MAG: hypothetical protein KTR33_13915 [Gammaproteobacteria bacterium]|nr:hypothetical protein [Gammaproteobacteria bacterium]
MVDNTTLNTGSGGDVIRTDDDGTAKWQYVKLAFGADNTYNIVTDQSTNPLPVVLADADTGYLSTISSAIHSEDAAHTTSDAGIPPLGVRQDTQASFGADGDYVPLSIDANGAVRVNAVNAGGTANADDVAGASDSGAVMLGIRDDVLTTLTQAELDYSQLRINSTGALWTTVDGTVTVDNGGTFAVQAAQSGSWTVTANLSATDNAVLDSIDSAVNGTLTVSGTVTANLSATDNAVLDTIETNTDFGTVTGGGTETGALRVTLANNSTGVVSVDDGGGSLTVDGTVTANLSATDNTVLDNIETNTGAIQTAVELIDNAISGTEMQVDVVAALPAGTNNIGDVDVASIAAGANLVGDVGLSGARTSGGTTIFRSIDLDESEEEIKSTAGQIYWIHAMNLATATRFLKVYNATAASVTVGTTTPVMTFPLATQGDTNGAGFTLSIPNGIALGTAITVAATTGIADSDTGAPGANEVIVNIGYA